MAAAHTCIQSKSSVRSPSLPPSPPQKKNPVYNPVSTPISKTIDYVHRIGTAHVSNTINWDNPCHTENHQTNIW